MLKRKVPGAALEKTCGTTRAPLFEAHITGSRELDHQVFTTILRHTRMKFEVDFFRRVINLDRRTELMGLGLEGLADATATSRIPTGHDLQEPGLMVTIRAETYSELAEQTRIILRLMASKGITHNFEVEMFLDGSKDPHIVDMARDFPGYRMVGDRPIYENHIGLHDEGGIIPNPREVIENLVRTVELRPHQIVEFSGTPNGKVVDSVVSYYQETA
ncbi:hypothetical protein HYT84_03305, partial [Candidatus Micrarchaeota archaeon]|nr:hypothetical protein [Candidatus Micrarchaeota archaeon]